MSVDVVIIGASARAAAESAVRAGLRPWCADLFADADLVRLCPAVRVDDYPRGLLDAVAAAPPAPVMYTGALENYPRLLARLRPPLWGNGADVVRRVRSPVELRAALTARGLACPGVRVDAPAQPEGWLLKRRRSAGGLGVRRYAGERFDPRTHYLQERIDGTPVSALFLGCDGRAELLGTTGQLVGTSWLHAEGFQYAGNIGPLALTPATCDAWQALGAALAQHFELRGLFGVDAILRDGTPWPVEVNPRYTASVEVLEAALTTSLFLLHRAVCERQFNRTPLASALAARARSGGDFFGKAILYARADVVFPRHGSWQHDPGRLRDIPQPGTHIPARQPVLTVLGRGATEAGCAAALREAAEALDRQLYG